MGGNGVVGDDDRIPDGLAGKQRPGEAHGARADMDRIGALAKRDLERAVVSFRHADVTTFEQGA